MTAPEPQGLYAVVSVHQAPAHHLAAPAEPTVYVSDGTYWYVLGSEHGWSWEQVVRWAVQVEVVREGIAAGVAS